MAFWQTNTIQSNLVDYGTAPNDGTGDSIRDAFIKVDENFNSLSNFLAAAGTDGTVDFQQSTVSVHLRSTGTADIANLFVSNATGTTASFTGNVTAGNLHANAGIYNSGVTTLTGNTTTGNVTINGQLNLNTVTVVSNHIIPTANLSYDLGSSTRYFRNIYAQGLVQINTVTASSDAGLLLLHANLLPGDTKDVGIFGKFADGGANSFAFFGHQATTNNFVYKITTTDATLGNSVVYDGFYAGAQFGSQLLSNTTASTSTTTGALIVAGGAGIAGAIYTPTLNGNVVSTVANIGRMSLSGNVSGTFKVDGNIFANGGQVLTSTSVGLGTLFTTASSIGSGPWIYVNGTQANGTTGTGAVSIPNGGLYVGGNIIANTGFVGTFFGNVNSPLAIISTLQAADSTIANLTVSNSFNTPVLNATSLGVTNITATGAINFTGATLTGLTSMTITGNVTTGNISGAKGTFTNIAGTITTAAQPNITSVGTLTGLTVTNPIVGSVTGTSATITGIYSGTLTSGQVTTALTYTPYNATNPSAYVTAAATLTTAAQPNITSVGTLTGLTVTNPIVGSVTGPAGSATTAGTVTTAAQPAITSVGTLTGLTVSGTIAASANNTINIGAAGTVFATVYATTFSGVSTTAKYADLAENYQSDTVYEPGTVVVFGGAAEITTTAELADAGVAGIISTNPAYLMNSDCIDGLPVALRGRVPCKVYGPVNKGDSLVTADNKPGFAVSIGKLRNYGQAVFAKSIETNLAEGEKVITAVVI